MLIPPAASHVLVYLVGSSPVVEKRFLMLGSFLIYGQARYSGNGFGEMQTPAFSPIHDMFVRSPALDSHTGDVICLVESFQSDRFFSGHCAAILTHLCGQL